MQLSKFVKFMALSSSFCPHSVSKSVRLFEGQGVCLICFSFIDIKALQAEVKKIWILLCGKGKMKETEEVKEEHIFL